MIEEKVKQNMKERNILYMDKAPDAYVEVMEAVKPQGFNLSGTGTR